MNITAELNFNCFQISFAVVSSIVTAVINTQTLKRELPRPKNITIPALETRLTEVEQPAQTSNRFVILLFFVSKY
jgi:hypothetical protein